MPAPPNVTPAGPPPPKKSGGKGCIIALVVVGVLIFLAIIGSIMAVTFFGKKASDTLNDAITSKPCTIITSSEAGSVLGGSYESVQLKGFNSLGQVVLDNRVLPDADGCWIRPANGNDGAQGRVAKASGGSATFKNELTKAKGTSQDQGNGVSIESLAYFSKDVDGLGDEAFCTDMSIVGSSGVVFRKGDSVYYVSITPDPNKPSSEDSCDLAVKLAKKAS